MTDDMALLGGNDAVATETPVTSGAGPGSGAAPLPSALPSEPGSTEPAEEAIQIEYPESESDAVDENSAPLPEGIALVLEEPSPASARFGPGALTRALAENQPLATALEQTPRLKSQLYQMARRSQELADYQDLVPSLARAREAVAAQQALGQIDETYYAGEPETFWQGLRKASGESGAYERHAQFLHRIFLDRLEADAGAGGNQDLSEAVQAIRESLGWGTSRSPRSRAQDGRFAATEASDDKLPLHIRRKLEVAEQSARELQHLRSRLSEGERQTNERFLDETAEAAGREVRAFVDGILGKTGMTDYDKANVTRDFLERVAELADQDKVHNAALEEILRAGGTTPETRARMVARVMVWARQNGRDILEPILQQAGAGLKQRRARAEAARATVRPEPSSTGAPANPTRPSARDLVKRAQEKLGRRLSDREILDLG